jgi:NADH-quinone oxidoreductase subunit C
MMTPQDAIARLNAAFPDVASGATEFRGEHSVSIARERLVDACRFLKLQCGFTMLTDLSGVDHYGEEPRYEVEYLLYAMDHRCHLRLKVRLAEQDAVIPSVTGVWQGADWHEREAFDMFGIRFDGHPNLKRILMWEGYPHHPLRKDFPLAGLPAELPDTAEGAGRVDSAPMAGGPFVPGTGNRSTISREPRQYDTGVEQFVKIKNPVKKESV